MVSVGVAAGVSVIVSVGKISVLAKLLLELALERFALEKILPAPWQLIQKSLLTFAKK